MLQHFTGVDAVTENCGALPYISMKISKFSVLVEIEQASLYFQCIVILSQPCEKIEDVFFAGIVCQILIAVASK